MKGQTARFVWDYHVNDRDVDFDSRSPRWFFYDSLSHKNIGYDNKFNSWKFTIDYKCPSRFRVRVNRESTATLVITNVTTADNGEYSCFLVLSSGISFPSSKAQLIVTETPMFTVRPNQTTITTEHSHLTINCTAVGPPTPNITWVRERGVIKVTMTKGVGNARLSFASISRHDSGKYECQAVNNPNQSPVSASTVITVYYPPQGPPVIYVVSIQPSSAVIIWTRPVYNGGSPVTGYKVLVNSTTIQINTSNVLHHKEITGLHDDTVYEVKVLARNIAGYGDASSKVFQTTKKGINTNSPSTSCDSCYGAAVVGVLAFFLSVSLLVIIMYVVYTIWTRNKTNLEQENTSVEMTSPISYSVPNNPQNGLTRDENRRSPTIPDVPNTPAEYAIPGNPDNRETSQEHYRQLNPATLQHDPTAQYEPLRTKHVTNTDQRNDTYMPLRNRPAEYQSLQTRSYQNCASFI